MTISGKPLPRWVFAVQRPDLMIRRLRGLDMEIRLEEIERFIGPPRSVIEAGAADGADTVNMARRWPSSKIYAFEPVPSAWDKMAKSVSGMSNIQPYPIALSDRTGHSDLRVSCSNAGGTDSSSLLAPSGHMRYMPEVAFVETITVETTTLSDFARRHDLVGVDLLRLDMQGMELATLLASSDFVRRCAAIMIETSRVSMYDGSPTVREVRASMQSLGFRCVVERTGRIYGNALYVARNQARVGG